MMIRTIEIETSRFSENPTKRWSYMRDCFMEDAYVEYPDELDELYDSELLDKADSEEDGVRYVDKPN